MALKLLNQFLKFDCDSFLSGKVLRVTGISENVDYNTKKHLGTKVEVVITRDDTPYHCKAGQVVSNRYEKLTLKLNKDVNVNLDDMVKPVNPIATVYGDYRNQLSIKCDDIQVLQPKQAGGQA